MMKPGSFHFSDKLCRVLISWTTAILVAFLEVLLVIETRTLAASSGKEQDRRLQLMHHMLYRVLSIHKLEHLRKQKFQH